MKKFTKICMITALITFIIGCLLFGVGALFGGLRQLEHINVRAVTGIPFRFARTNSIWSFGFWDDDRDDDWELDTEEWKDLETTGLSTDAEETGSSKEELAGSTKGQTTGLTADTIRKLDLEVGACKMYIEETDGQDVSIAIQGECEDHYRYRIKEGNTLLLVHKDMAYDEYETIWGRSHPKGDTKVYLYLPRDIILDEISIDFGAGKLEAGYLKARGIEIDAGAGECSFEGLEASESIEISMGAGKLTTGALITSEADLDIAAGELTVDGAQVSRSTEINVSMGNATIQGSFAGEVSADCSMGNLNFVLDGAQEDYDYEIDCGAGEVWIGNKRCSAWMDDHEIHHGIGPTLDITCAMGTVKMDFTK